MAKKKNDADTIDETGEQAEPGKSEYRDPTEEQAREMVARLSPDGIAILERALAGRSRNRIGRDRQGKQR